MKNDKSIRMDAYAEKEGGREKEGQERVDLKQHYYQLPEQAAGDSSSC